MAESASQLPVSSEGRENRPARAGDVAPFENLRQEIDRLFEDFRPFNWRMTMPRALLGLDAPRMARTSMPLVPAIDVAEKDTEYEITAELPGIDEKNVDIRVANNMLTIKGEKKQEKEERQTDYYLSERRFGAFQRSFSLPQGVDPDRIEASFASGVLKVKLPKTEESQRSEKKISIKAG